MRKWAGSLCVVVLAGGAGIIGSGCGRSAGVPRKDVGAPSDAAISSGGVTGTGGVIGTGAVVGSGGAAALGGMTGTAPGGAGGAGGTGTGGSIATGMGGRNTGGAAAGNSGGTAAGAGGAGTGGVGGSGGARTGGVVGSGGSGMGGTPVGGTGGSMAGGAGGTAARGTGGAMARDASADGAQDSPGIDDSAAETSGNVGGTCGLPTAAASGMACDSEPRPAGEPSGAVVETDCFSGLPNPTAPLPTQGLEQLQCVLRQAPAGPAAERPARLGYRGMVVRFEGGTQVIEVYQGAIIVREGANVLYQVDNGRALEQYLWCFVGVDVQD